MKQETGVKPRTKSARTHRVSFMLNDEEYGALRRYMEKYRITNKSNWYRTTMLLHILKVMEADYPTLFNEYEMRR